MEKEYGQSILNYSPALDVEIESPFENAEELNEKDKDKFLDEVRNDPDESGKHVDIVSIDPVTGIRAASKVEPDSINRSFSEVVNERENKGKTLNQSSISLLKQVLRDDVPDEVVSNIVSYFESVDDIENEKIEDIETSLGDDVITALKKSTLTNDYTNVLRRFVSQLYDGYMYQIQYNDDVSTVMKAIATLKDLNASIKEDGVKDVRTLDDVQAKINETLQLFKSSNHKRDSRDNFSVDDIDIRLMEDIKECLDVALSFQLIYDKVDSTYIKYKIDFKRDKEIDRTINNWVNDIRSDNTTIFPFPVNDLDTKVSELTDGFLSFIFSLIMMEETKQYAIEDDVTDLEQYLRDKGYITDADILRYEKMAKVFLYVLSRVFKHKNITTDRDRRILSYTLDIISKSGMRDYREKTVGLIKYMYDKIIG